MRGQSLVCDLCSQAAVNNQCLTEVRCLTATQAQYLCRTMLGTLQVPYVALTLTWGGVVQSCLRLRWDHFMLRVTICNLQLCKHHQQTASIAFTFLAQWQDLTMEPVSPHTVKEALDLIQDEPGLPYPSRLLLEYFVTKSLQPLVAAAYVL